jgi:hypothetical protein
LGNSNEEHTLIGKRKRNFFHLTLCPEIPFQYL